MLKLYDYFRSSACCRVRITLNLKKINYEKIPIHLVQNGGEQYTEHYQKINPQSLVPALQIEEKLLTQSLAIMEYLEEKYPKPSIFPVDPYHKALTRAFALTIIADIHPLNNLRVLNYLTQQLNVSDEEKDAWYKHWIQKGLTALEKQLQNLGLMKNFCFGDFPTLADICLIPQMINAKRFNCELSEYPNLLKIYDNCYQLPEFVQALPNETAAVIA